jgi:hypothetical protein
VKRIIALLLPLLLIVALVIAFGFVSAPAWNFDASVTPYCNPENNTKSVGWSFHNNERVDRAMDITVSLSGQPDQHASNIAGGSSASGTFSLGTGVVLGGSVHFALNWHNQPGSDSTDRTFGEINNCVSTATVTATNTPISVPSDTPTSTPQPTSTTTDTPQNTPTGTQVPTNTPNSTDTQQPTGTNLPTSTHLPTRTNQPPSTNTVQPTSTLQSSRTPIHTPQPTVTQPAHQQVFTPPTGSSDCAQATITNNADVGIHVVLKVDEVEIWNGDLGVYSTMHFAWSYSGTHTATVDWTGYGSGTIGLGSFGPCSQSTPIQSVRVITESVGPDISFVSIGHISLPRLSIDIPISKGWIDGVGIFHHSLRSAGKVSDTTYAIHQSFAPNLSQVVVGDRVWIDNHEYQVDKIVIVIQKDQQSMNDLIASGVTLITCTADWQDNLVIVLRD